MPHRVPNLTELRAQARDDYRAKLPGADSLLPVSNLRVVGDVQAELVYGLYGYQLAVVRDLMPDTAEDEWLERRAATKGIFRKPAAAASGTVLLTGTEGAGVDAGAELQTKSGVVLAVAEGVVLGAGATPCTVEAAVAGAAGNLDAGTALSFRTAISGVDADAVVAAGGIAGGAEAERDDALRARYLDRLREPPQGGALGDYRQWALEVPGVTRVWPARAEMGPGTVTVRFMMDEVRADDAGIPQGTDASDYAAGDGDQQIVFDHISELRPLGADVFVVAPVPVPLDVEIADLHPDTPAVRAAILSELADMLYRDAEPGGTIRLSRIGEAVSVATGEGHHTLVAPAADVTHGAGEIAVPGALSFE
ncbi:baseplate J/gp47 family protein [Parvibaculum sp.]|uniref:baseplate J/gp47 family protein n=1 Tax=Parvibaculum sp. TaxID=2024848 RepID=UPI002731DFAC|nr:baseplate J/gp47 family protein [Parvibaculum sp.]MDP1628866.1 baseplate J/gp47 family protein [Parvibaculum sp.]MDP2148261.1 baseplate J/gp47 family protein [Parvibaculum sp.]MDP3327742.1 baseplate J/gp47 family protein [Parvibaculum sp.]